MNKYVFEMYELSERGRIFKGYKTVQAEDSEQAKQLAQDQVGDKTNLFQIYTPAY